MSPEVLVVGAGYAGTGVVTALDDGFPEVDVTWVSVDPYHEVKHEVHRVIRKPGLATALQIPIDDIQADLTRFHTGRVVGVDPDSREVRLAEGDTLNYDYLVLTPGAQTAFYGIPGLREHAFQLRSVENALAINEAITTRDDRETVRVVVGGGGLSGVQTAGEIAALGRDTGLGVDITIVEALETILPGEPAALRSAVAARLAGRGVSIRTDEPIVEVTATGVELDGGDHLAYDVLVWTGGISGRDVIGSAQLGRLHHRIETDARFRTDDPRIFGVGDAAAISQPDGVAPPTAQAAWQAAPVAAANVVATDRGEELREWRYRDKGTLVSIGEAAVAHDVAGIPVETFGSLPAQTLKKAVAARWIGGISSWRRVVGLWSDL